MACSFSRLACLFLLTLGFGVAQPLLAEDTRLAPSSPWNLRYELESCQMVRTFGEGKDKTVFYLESYGLTGGFSLVLAGKPLRTLHQDERIPLRFGAKYAEQTLPFKRGKLAEFSPALIFSRVFLGPAPAADDTSTPSPQTVLQYENAPRQENGAKWLAVGTPGKAVVLELGPMEKVMQVVCECSIDLMKSWGLDIERHRTMTRLAEPVGDFGSWLISSDYPVVSVLRGTEANLYVRMMVDETGAPTSCHVQATTSPEFGEISCQGLMKRARFNPALDAAGVPMPSIFQTSINYRLP